MTRQQEQFFRNYEFSNHYDLFSAYAKPSHNKERIWNMIVRECAEMDGWGLKLCTHNHQVFTAAFKFTRHEKTWLRYYTPARELEFPIE